MCTHVKRYMHTILEGTHHALNLKSLAIFYGTKLLAPALATDHHFHLRKLMFYLEKKGTVRSHTKQRIETLREKVLRAMVCNCAPPPVCIC